MNKKLSFCSNCEPYFHLSRSGWCHERLTTLCGDRWTHHPPRVAIIPFRSSIKNWFESRADGLMESEEKTIWDHKKRNMLHTELLMGRNASRIGKKKTNHISLKLKLIPTLSTGWTCETIDVFIPAPYAFWWLPISSIFSCPFPFFHLVFNSLTHSLILAQLMDGAKAIFSFSLNINIIRVEKHSIAPVN